eukprot:570380-Hanusia_phi.AAC.1
MAFGDSKSGSAGDRTQTVPPYCGRREPRSRGQPGLPRRVGASATVYRTVLPAESDRPLRGRGSDPDREWTQPRAGKLESIMIGRALCSEFTVLKFSPVVEPDSDSHESTAEMKLPNQRSEQRGKA